MEKECLLVNSFPKEDMYSFSHNRVRFDMIPTEWLSRYSIGRLCCLFLFLYFALFPVDTLLAADATNSGTINGNWKGTAGDDNYTNETGATVKKSIDMTQGGTDTVINKGTVGKHITGGSSSGNTVDNSGNVGLNMTGSYNKKNDSSGGSNTVKNSGTVGDNFYGSYNEGRRSRGGSNTVSNSGKAKASIIGSYNEGRKSNGGLNMISNDRTVNGDMVGSEPG